MVGWWHCAPVAPLSKVSSLARRLPETSASTCLAAGLNAADFGTLVVKSQSVARGNKTLQESCMLCSNVCLDQITTSRKGERDQPREN